MKAEKKMYENPELEIIGLTKEDVFTNDSSTSWKDPAELEEIPD